jgi:hypothetical protein
MLMARGGSPIAQGSRLLISRAIWPVRRNRQRGALAAQVSPIATACAPRTVPLVHSVLLVVCVLAMADARIVHDLDCSESVFWDKLFLDGEFNRRMFVEALKFAGWRVVRESDKTVDPVEIEVEATPPIGDLPGPLRAIVGDGISYREIGKCDRRCRRYTVQVKSNTLGDKLLVDGELSTEAIDENRCRRVFTVRVTAKIFGVGGMLEKRVLADLERNYEASARYINQHAKALQ